MPETIPSDEELLGRMAAGGEEAFILLYRRRQPAVFRFALQMSGSEAVAEDVTQEVFLALMRDASRFSPDRGSLPAYLYGMARNFVLRHLDRREEPGDAAALEQAPAAGDPLTDLTRNERIESVRDAVLALPLHYREVVVLCDLDEMNYADAAAALGCAVGTVRSRLHRARALLAEKLRLGQARGPAPRALRPRWTWTGGFDDV